MDIEEQKLKLIEVKRNAAEKQDEVLAEYADEQISILAAKYSMEQMQNVNFSKFIKNK